MPQSRDLVLAMLHEQKFAIIDGFLPETLWERLAAEARALRAAGSLRLGRLEQKGTHGEYWGSDEVNEADFLKRFLGNS